MLNRTFSKLKKQTIGYWVTTALVGFAFAAGGLGDLLGSPEVMGAMAHLGYPAYVASILGVWKMLGAAAIVAPGMPRVKEWAYAGMFFDLTGAAISHAVLGDGVSAVLTPLVLSAVVAASWALRPASRKLESHAPPLAQHRLSAELHPTA